MTKYNIRYVHKISPRPTDTDTFESGAFDMLAIGADRKAVGKALREAGILMPGQRVRECRVDGARLVVFPERSTMHAFIIEVADVETYDLYTHVGEGLNDLRTMHECKAASIDPNGTDETRAVAAQRYSALYCGAARTGHLGFGHGATDAVETAYKWSKPLATGIDNSGLFAVEIRSRVTGTVGGFFCSDA